MKRTERHHLKANPLAGWVGDLLGAARDGGRGVGAAGGLVLAVLVIVGLVFGWQQWRGSRASELLASAMAIVDAPVVPPVTPADDADGSAAPFEQPAASYPSLEAKLETAVPKLLEAADAYPGLPQGIAARYQAAAALGALGRTAEADDQYQRVIDLSGDSIYGRMARLARAEARLQGGEFTAAIALFEQETAVTESEVPVDAVLMRLGRAYQLADQPTEAIATFTRVIEEFPASAYRADAEREVEVLRGH